jgi:hypothetical protein
MDDQLHPCQKCGACCSMYRVTFRSIETHEDSFGVPADLTVKVSPETSAMKFNNPKSQRCVALKGSIGKNVGCSIYDNRPSPCRNFKASFEDGTQNPRCDEARAVMGLQPLSPEDWGQPQEHIIEIL